MSTPNVTHLEQPDPDTYDICINHYQRMLLYKALNHMCAMLYATQWLTAEEFEVAKNMRKQLDPHPEGDIFPLRPDRLNSFVK